MISRHLSNCACCRGVGSSPDDPGAPEVRAVALVGDADVGPQHITGGQFALGCQQRQAPGRRAWSTPRRPCTCGITCQIGSSMLAIAPSSNVAAHEAARQVDLPNSGRQCGSGRRPSPSSVIRIAVRMQDSSSGVLMSLAAPTTGSGVDRASGPEQPDSRTRHRPGAVRRRRSPPRPESGPSITRAKFSTPSSNSRYTGPCR